MSIPYGRQWLDESDIDAVVQVLRSDWLTTGPAVGAFEDAVAAVAGTDSAVAVSSGTAALHAAWHAAGIGPGDEVVVPPLTFVATASTAALLGATVVFADVREDTGNLDPAAADAAATSRTAGIAAVDYAGHPADLDDLLTVARSHDAVLIEDAAHSIGGRYRGRPVGSIADLTTFSFFPTKNATTGEGGAVTGLDPDLVERARRFRSHGIVRDRDELCDPGAGPWHHEVHEFGLNYRLPDVLAALGISQLRRLAEFRERRNRIFERYREGLADIDGLRLPVVHDDVEPMWHLYPVRVDADRRAALYETLHAAGILVQVNYLPVYWHPVFQDLGYRKGLCPVAEAYSAQELSLPMYAALTPDDQDRVIETVRGFFGAGS